MDKAIEDIKEKSVDRVKEGIKLIGESLTEVFNAITECKGAVEAVENILSVLKEGPLCRGPGVQPRLSPPTHPAVIGAQYEAVLPGNQMAGGSGLRGTKKGKKKPKKKGKKNRVRRATRV